MGTLEVAAKVGAMHDQLVEKIAEGAQRLNVPGVAVGVYLSGEQDYAFHGVTSIENPLEVNEKTFFQIGSTSKTYTATVMMILAEKGEVDLDAPVRRYVPELKLKDKSVVERVTVFHLLNHTAGWYGDVFTDTGDGDDAIAKYVAQLVDVEQMRPLGGAASYNNAALILAGRVIEKVTDKRFEDAVRELLLDPVGLEESFYFMRDVMTRRFAVGHTEKDDVLMLSRRWPISRASNPAGGIISTTADQIKYARFHLGGGTGKNGQQVITADSVRRMRQATADLRGGRLGDHVGIAWLLREIDGVQVVAHGGGTNGQLSAFEMVPERDFALTVLTNAKKGGRLRDELTKWALEAYAGLKQPDEAPLPLSVEDLEAYAGTFSSITSLLTVKVVEDYLVIDAEITEEGKRQAMAFLGEEPPKPKPVPFRILPRDRFIVIEGDSKDMKGSLLRDDTGRVTAIEVGGRLAHRVES